MGSDPSDPKGSDPFRLRSCPEKLGSGFGDLQDLREVLELGRLHVNHHAIEFEDQ